MGAMVRERFDVATRALCGTLALPGACLAGAVTLLLGGVCWANAFVVPGLFGPVAAAVVAAERLLCAARSSSTSSAAVWTGVALGWIAVAACMLHAPLLSVRGLTWLVALLALSSMVYRLWTRLEALASEPAPAAIWAAAVVAQLATLFGVTAAAPLAPVAAAVAIELVLIGVVRLLHAGSRRDAPASVANEASRLGATANLDVGMIKIETGIA
jgi:hypothetical protein